MVRVMVHVTLAVAAALLATPAVAQQNFFEGKTITIITSTGSGGSYDTTARLVARHMPRHIPGNPTMIVQNMPGGGNVIAANHVFTVAPRDGTVIATLHNALPLHQVLDGKGVRYDASKLNWLGSTGSENEVIFTWHTTGVTNIEQAKNKEVILGGTGAGSGIVIIPLAMNNLLGTKFKIVMGYKSTAELDLAMERGEVAARAGASLAGILQERPTWIEGNKVVVLNQIGEERDKAFPQVPLMHELAKTNEQRQILSLLSLPPALGRPFFTTPDVPAERAAALRRAFEATMKDEAFLKEARQLNLEMNPFGGERAAKIVNDTINVPADLIARAKAILEPK